MIKKTLYFGNPAYLSTSHKQLIIKFPEIEKSNVPISFKENTQKSIPIEDIGMIVLDHSQITLTQGLISELMENSCCILSCNKSHLPHGILLPLTNNTTVSERVRYQLESSIPLRKNLWQQTIQAKISNQASILQKYTQQEYGCMLKWAEQVKSGDSDNLEGRAAAYYWKYALNIPGFVRNKDGQAPNTLLNYGYAILRALVARSLVTSGLLPILGIHHHNKYNAYCLADDIMEPYRPFVDQLVIYIMKSEPQYEELTTSIKSKLLSIPTLDVIINGKRSPLMIAVGITTASLYKCYSGELRKIIYPNF